MQAALELRLDEANNNWRNCQAKVSEMEMEVAKRDTTIQVASARLRIYYPSSS
jgi:hypothetical protein